ncbi:unnamed protein product [Chironomus riparius]|uniref:C-type lectin domain-containing protein n=1 Tax=Chironomus riparius TaxID=315576 RepID=A0A9N9RYJ0_9DIPT|nr:unnamed protein product [Chironomus riparius]
MFKKIFILTSWLLLANSEPIKEILEDEPIGCQAQVTNGFDIAFVKVGTYRGYTNEGKEYQKSYFFPKYFRNGMAEAKAICKAYNLELATFETITETLMVLNMCENNEYIKSIADPKNFWIVIDAMTTTPKSATEWFWTNSGRKISFTVPWAPNQPDFFENHEYCLAIGKDQSTPNYRFNDMPCLNINRPFLCQNFDYMITL